MQNPDYVQCFCEIASEIATLRMLHMPCTQGQICPKSPTFGGGVQVLHMDMEKVMEDPGCLQLSSTLDVPGPSFTSAQPPRGLVSSLKRHPPGLEIIV